MTPAPPGGTVLDPPQVLSDFTLTSQTGDPLSLSDLRGRAALMSFGYTHCPDVCPLTLARFRQVSTLLGDQAEDVAFVFVSVDGQRDTPERLAEYLSAFSQDFIGLTGEEDVLRPVTQDFGVFFEIEQPEGSQADYLVSHTASSFLVDREGQLRVVFPYETAPEAIAADIQEILAEDFGRS